MIEGKEAVAIAGCFAGALSFWAAVYGWGKWLHRPQREPALQPSMPAESLVSDARIGRIEAALESIAVEVERIGEGQRFTTRLLTERTAASRSPLPGEPPVARTYAPLVTPH